ncbi:MAG: hypothetical protein L0G70_01570 [Rubrobacter sp.]|nr:hypothetical protein [Rubrobacter sp.]
MRGALFWLASTVAAFAITAGVFLVLAEMGTDPPEQSLSADGGNRSEPRAPLSMELRESDLESLEAQEDQSLRISLENRGERELTSINVYLALSSEDTSKQETRYYEAELQDLQAGESRNVSFDLDLSPPENGGEQSYEDRPEDSSEEEMNILEARAASSEGASTVNTAVLSL